MAKSGCLQSFNDGKARRVTCPLHQGRYKLEEQKRSLVAIKESLHMVRHFVSGRSSSIYLGCCMASDKHRWLKDLPLDIAFSLGYDLLPGLLALTKEGARRVDSAYPAIALECEQLVDRLEQTRNAIKKDISVEYQHMKQGGSLLEPLIDDAISITHRALAVK